MITPLEAIFGSLALLGTIGCVLINTRKGRRWINRFFKSLEKKWEED